MTREEKLVAIYAEMANKEDSFWLRFIAKFQDYKDKYFDARELTTLFWREDEDWEVFREAITDGGLLRNHYYLDENAWYIPHIKRGEVLKIIWHPVMLGTIFEWYSSSRWFINSQFVMELVDKWTGYDESIDEQSDECIDYVYSLIPKS